MYWDFVSNRLVDWNQVLHFYGRRYFPNSTYKFLP